MIIEDIGTIKYSDRLYKSKYGMVDRVGGFREKAGGDAWSTSHPPESREET